MAAASGWAAIAGGKRMISAVAADAMSTRYVAPPASTANAGAMSRAVPGAEGAVAVAPGTAGLSPAGVSTAVRWPERAHPAAITADATAMATRAMANRRARIGRSYTPAVDRRVRSGDVRRGRGGLGVVPPAGLEPAHMV